MHIVTPILILPTKGERNWLYSAVEGPLRYIERWYEEQGKPVHFRTPILHLADIDIEQDNPWPDVYRELQSKYELTDPERPTMAYLPGWFGQHSGLGGAGLGLVGELYFELWDRDDWDNRDYAQGLVAHELGHLIHRADHAPALDPPDIMQLGMVALSRSRLRPVEKSAYEWPVAGGNGMWPIYRDSAAHGYDAIDLGNQTNLGWVAVHDAAVTFSGSAGDCGLSIALTFDDARGHHIVHYCHGDRLLIPVGHRVSRGQIIGYVGTTGEVYYEDEDGRHYGDPRAAHLHLWWELNGQRVKPEEMLA